MSTSGRMLDNDLIVSYSCDGCGAPLPSSLKCAYCGRQHERVRRYSGAELPEEPLYRNVLTGTWVPSSQCYVYSSSNLSTCATSIPLVEFVHYG